MAFTTVFMPAKVSASCAYSPSGYYGGTCYEDQGSQTPNYYYSSPTYSTYNSQPNTTYAPAPTMTYVYPTPTPTVYSSNTNPNLKTTPKTVAKAKVTSPLAKANNSNNSNLAANTIFASNSFIPSGIIGWMIFAILVLLMVILVRKIYGADEAYHAIPMKHN